MPSYLFILVILSIVAISMQLYLSTTLMAKAVALFKTNKTLRVSTFVLLMGILCWLLFRFAGDRLFRIIMLFASYYKFLVIAVLLVSLAYNLYKSTIWSTGLNLYNKARGIRISIWFLVTGVLLYLFFLLAGDQAYSIILLLTPEYLNVTIASIVTFFILSYVSSKNKYEILNVFGSVILIIWISVSVIATSVHLGIHYHLLDKTLYLFTYLDNALPGNYRILPYIILASWIINFFALLYVTGRRISNILDDYITQRFRDSYQEKIIELINEDVVENESSPDEQLYFKKVNRLFYTRQIFSAELLRMHELVYGSLHDQIHRLFHSLSLTEDAFNYLHSSRWFYKIKGLRIYAELGDSSEIAYIQKIIKSKNSILRFEAQLALTRLSDDERPLDYLKDLEQSLTMWEQLNLIHFYTNHKKPLGDLSGLLESKNVTVICFALECIHKFNRYEYRNQILELTLHSDGNVQNAAFRTLTLFEEAEIGSYILSRYNQDMSLSTRINIIRTLGRIGDAGTIIFLKEQISIFELDVICIELFKALILIDSQQAIDMANSDDLRFMRIYQHVTETSI